VQEVTSLRDRKFCPCLTVTPHAALICGERGDRHCRGRGHALSAKVAARVSRLPTLQGQCVGCKRLMAEIQGSAQLPQVAELSALSARMLMHSIACSLVY
jgi:hypothetical protein